LRWSWIWLNNSSQGCLPRTANCVGPEEKDLLLRVCFDAEYLWINFKDINFSTETGKVIKLDLGKNQSRIYSGNAVKDFQAAKPFKFLGVS
jgi:hypothetical protein